AEARLYAGLMAKFIEWVAPQYEEIKRRWPGWDANARTKATLVGGHARTPGIVAELAVAFRVFLAFAESDGAITRPKREELRDQFWDTVTAVSASQILDQVTHQPENQFLRLVSAVVSSGRAHIAATNGDPPKGA